jgi:hypothetical protein
VHRIRIMLNLLSHPELFPPSTFTQRPWKIVLPCISYNQSTVLTGRRIPSEAPWPAKGRLFIGVLLHIAIDKPARSTSDWLTLSESEMCIAVTWLSEPITIKGGERGHSIFLEGYTHKNNRFAARGGRRIHQRSPSRWLSVTLNRPTRIKNVKWVGSSSTPRGDP